LGFNGRGEFTTIFDVANPDIQEGIGTEPAPPRRLGTVAAAVLIGLALVAATSRIWNYDIFWHLTAGEWMLDHGKVLGHDPFSIPPAGGGEREWINVHWGFQVIAAGLHRLWGFAALTAMKGVLLGLTVAALAFWLKRRVDAWWLLVVGVWLVVGIESRVRARPEVFTFAFLTSTLLLVESVRRGASPRRLWWLAPINVLWVNMHGLYVLGPAAVWAAMGVEGCRRALGLRTSRLGSRRALAAMAVATLVCLVSPWPLRAALHPLVLWTRIAGHGQEYTKAVSELATPWRVNSLHNVPVLLTGAMAVAAVAAMAARAVLSRRTVPLVHVLWLVMFTVPAAMATRNTAIALPPLALLLAIHGQGVWDELGRRGRTGGWARRAGAVPAMVLPVALACSYATEAMFRWQERPEARWGLGLSRLAQPLGPARWIAESPAAGDIMPLGFGNGGLAMYYGRPRRVSMDGRLELHTLDELKEHNETVKRLGSIKRAGAPADTPLPPSVRFLILRPGAARQINAMAGNPKRFRCLYVDASGVLFERIPLPGEKVTFAADPPTRRDGLDVLDRPIEPGQALIPGAPTRRWYRQNPPGVHWLVGAELYALGRYGLAARYLDVARQLGLASRAEVTCILAHAHQGLSRRDDLVPDGDYPADVNLSRALMLYRGLKWQDLDQRDVPASRMAYVSALLADNQVGAAARVAGNLRAHPKSPKREVREIEKTRQFVRARHEAAVGRGRRANILGLQPAERAQLLASPLIGLVEEAIELIRSDPTASPADWMLLGDLYLRQGLPDEARRAYDNAEEGWQRQMRLGLCDWVEGRFARAAETLAEAADDPAGPAPPTVYLAMLNEQTGHYQDVGAVLAAPPIGPGAGNEQTLRLLILLQGRLPRGARGTERNKAGQWRLEE